MVATSTDQNLLRRVGELERLVADIRKKTGLGNATITRGAMAVSADGGVVLTDLDGRPIVRLGAEGTAGGFVGIQVLDPATGITQLRIGQTALGGYGIEAAPDSTLQITADGVTVHVDGVDLARVGHLSGGGYGIEVTDGFGNLRDLAAFVFGLVTDSVPTTETTTSTTFDDLTTAGPAVTCDVSLSGRALVRLTTYLSCGAGDGAYAGFDVSGATTLPPDIQRVVGASSAATHDQQSTAEYVVGGLNQGANTFTMKYLSVAGGAATFANRTITAVPL